MRFVTFPFFGVVLGHAFPCFVGFSSRRKLPVLTPAQQSSAQHSSAQLSKICSRMKLEAGTVIAEIVDRDRFPFKVSGRKPTCASCSGPGVNGAGVLETVQAWRVLSRTAGARTAAYSLQPTALPEIVLFLLCLFVAKRMLWDLQQLPRKPFLYER